MQKIILSDYEIKFKRFSKTKAKEISGQETWLGGTYKKLGRISGFRNYPNAGLRTP